MQPEKENMGRQCSIVCLIFQRLCDDYQCGGAPVRVFEKFCSPFSFLPFFPFSPFSFLSLSLSLSLSGALLAPGPLDIVHPCHPIATPLSRRARGRLYWLTCLNILILTLDNHNCYYIYCNRRWIRY